jgi:hypothetical protein
LFTSQTEQNDCLKTIQIERGVEFFNTAFNLSIVICTEKDYALVMVQNQIEKQQPEGGFFYVLFQRQLRGLSPVR